MYYDINGAQLDPSSVFFDDQGQPVYGEGRRAYTNLDDVPSVIEQRQRQKALQEKFAAMGLTYDPSKSSNPLAALMSFDPSPLEALADGTATISDPSKFSFDSLFSDSDKQFSKGEFGITSKSYQDWAKNNPIAFAKDAIAHRNSANGDLGSVGAEGGYSDPSKITVGANGIPDYSNAGYMNIHDDNGFMGLGDLGNIAALAAIAYGGYGLLSGLGEGALAGGAGSIVGPATGSIVPNIAGGVATSLPIDMGIAPTLLGSTAAGTGALSTITGSPTSFFDSAWNANMTTPSSMGGLSGGGIPTGVNGIGTVGNAGNLGNGLNNLALGTNAAANASLFPGASTAALTSDITLPSIGQVASNGMLGSMGALTAGATTSPGLLDTIKSFLNNTNGGGVLTGNNTPLGTLFGAGAQLIGNNLVDKSVQKDIDAMFTKLGNMGGFTDDQRKQLGNISLQNFQKDYLDPTRVNNIVNDFNSNPYSDAMNQALNNYNSKPYQAAIDSALNDYNSRPYQDLIDSASSSLQNLFNSPMNNPIMQATARIASENAIRRSAAGRGLNSGSMQSELQDALLTKLGEQFNTISNPYNTAFNNATGAQNQFRSTAANMYNQAAANQNAYQKAAGDLYNSLASTNVQRQNADVGLLNSLANSQNAATYAGTSAGNLANSNMNAAANLMPGALSATIATNPTVAGVGAIGAGNGGASSGGSNNALGALGTAAGNILTGGLSKLFSGG